MIEGLFHQPGDAPETRDLIDRQTEAIARAEADTLADGERPEHDVLADLLRNDHGPVARAVALVIETYRSGRLHCTHPSLAAAIAEAMQTIETGYGLDAEPR